MTEINNQIWEHKWRKKAGEASNYQKTLQINIVKRFIKNKRSILDIGCGTGEWAKAMMDAGFSVEGIDFSITAVQKCIEKGIKACCSNFVKKFPDQKYDVIYSSHVLEHLNFEERYRTIKNSYNALNDDGLFIAITPFNEDLYYNEIVCPYCTSKFHSQGHKSSMGLNTLSDELELSGLNIVFKKIIYPLPLTSRLPVDVSCYLLDLFRKNGFVSPMTDIIVIARKA